MVNLKKSEKFQKKQEINAQRLVHFFPVSDIFENRKKSEKLSKKAGKFLLLFID